MIAARPRRAVAPFTLATVALAAGVLSAAGCIKEKESLIIVALTSEIDLKNADQVEIAAGATHQTYAITGISSKEVVRRGIYVDAKTTGDVAVTATLQTGTPCVRYGKGGTVSVPSAGATVEIALKLTAVGPCSGGGNDGGAAGGAAGNGMAGAGGSGAGGSGSGGAAGGVGAGGRLGTGGGTGLGGGTGTGGATGTGGRIDAGVDVAPDAGTDTRDAGSDGPATPTLVTCNVYYHTDTTDCSSNPTIYGVALSPSGQLLATAGDDHRVKIWRFDGRTLTAEGHVLPAPTGATGFGMLSWSPDGSLLAVGWSTGIDLWNTTTWIRARALTTAGTIYDLGFAPDGTQIFSIDSGTLYVHNITTAAALHTQVIPELTWYMSVLPTAVTTPVIAVATQGGAVRLFTHTAAGFALSGSPLPVTTVDNHPESVRFSRDGRFLAAGDDLGQVRIWSYPITSTTPSMPLIDVGTPTLSDLMYALDFTPDGQTLVVAGGAGPSISTWAVAPPRANIAATINLTSSIFAITFAANGKAIIGAEYSCGVIRVCVD